VDLFAEIRKSFVDTEKVRAAMQRGKKRGLSKFGAHLRTRSRSSIKRRKKSSSPGQPPSAHAKGNSGLKLIFFAWDDKTESVVVGPISFQSKLVGEGVVPKLLETGGDVTRTVPEKRADGRIASDAQKAAFARKIKDGSIVVPDRLRKSMTFHYPGNPYMAPALEAEAPNFPKLFANTVQ